MFIKVYNCNLPTKTKNILLGSGMYEHQRKEARRTIVSIRLNFAIYSSEFAGEGNKECY